MVALQASREKELQCHEIHVVRSLIAHHSCNLNAFDGTKTLHTFIVE